MSWVVARVHDGTGAGRHDPEAHVYGAVAQGVGVFVEGKPPDLYGVFRDAKGLQHGAGHVGGARARGSYGDHLALYVGDVLYAALFKRHHLHQVGVHDAHAEDVHLALEFALAVVGARGHVAHDLAYYRLALVGQLDVFHAGSGDFRHRLYAGHLLGPDFGQSAAVGIVHPAGTAGADGDELGLGHGRHCQGHCRAYRQDDNQTFHTRLSLRCWPAVTC